MIASCFLSNFLAQAQPPAQVQLQAQDQAQPQLQLQHAAHDQAQVQADAYAQGFSSQRSRDAALVKPSDGAPTAP